MFEFRVIKPDEWKPVPGTDKLMTRIDTYFINCTDGERFGIHLPEKTHVLP